MKRTNNGGRTHQGWRMSLILLITMVVLTTCMASYAQTATSSGSGSGSGGGLTLIGTPGAGWQTWNLATDVNGEFIDLNSNNSPYWDVPFLAFSFGSYYGNPAAKSVGWCLTSNGDCQGIGSAQAAPGPLPFWGNDYIAATDSGGTIDPKMYFRTSGQSYQATLFLNTATNTREINEFGWFETNSSGTKNGNKHILFNGSGYPPGTQTPDPVGKTVTFTPTTYFGFYYSDVSDPETLNGPEHGCWAYTIFTFNDEDCTAATGQGDHVFAIFLQQSSGQAPTYWVAGQDPSACSEDGDCNLTLVKVSPAAKKSGGN